MTLLTLAAAYLMGTLLALRFDLSAPALGLFLLSSVLAVALALTVRRFSLLMLLSVVLLLAMLRVVMFHGDDGLALAPYRGLPAVQVEGVVSSDPEAAGVATRFRFSVDRVGQGGRLNDASGDLLVTLRESVELARLRGRPYFRYGDRLLLEGALEAPPELGEFDYPAYLARQGIGFVMSFPKPSLLDEGQGSAFYRGLYRLRGRMAEGLARIVPEPQASLGQALLLGRRDNLPPELVDEFQATGVSHVLAISGLHVGILLGLSLAASRLVFGARRHLYLITPLVLIWLYAFISGMSPSAVRAAIMGSVFLMALFLGRPRSVLPALGFAAAAMASANPNVIQSVSFQLSFAAIAGIVLWTEPLSRALQSLHRTPSGGKRPSFAVTAFLTDAVAMTIAATIATLPLVAFYFERVSLVGLPTTILVLPMLPAVLVTHAMAALLGNAGTFWVEPLGWIAWLTAGYVTGVVELISRLPGTSMDTGPLAPLLVWTYYGLLSLFAFRGALSRALLRWSSGVSALSSAAPLLGRGVSAWVLALVVSVSALIWIAALSTSDSSLRVAFVDVGQGDAIFISAPGGQQIVVDGGADPLQIARYLGERMPFWDRSIELVVLTHPHHDHVNGLIEVLRRYHVRRILHREVDYESPSYEAWLRGVADEGAEVIDARSGQVIAMGGGAFIQVLGPPDRLLSGTSSDVNNASVVLKLVRGDVSFLLTGDMFVEEEGVLVDENAPIDADVLKVGHHGSRTSSSAAFLDGVSPAVAVISVGEGNSFGHPDPEVENDLRRRVPEGHLLLTRDSGTIEFSTDGRSLKVKTGR